MSESTLRNETPHRGALLPTIVIVGVALAVLVIFARTWTDYLWYQSVNFRGVFTTQLAAQLGLFAVFGIFLAAILYISMAVAYRLRPKVRRANLDSELLVQLRDVLDRRSKVMMIIPAVVLGFIGGSVAAGMFQTFLAWTQSTPFGRKDAQFGLDAAFYVFQLPWWRFVLGYVTFSVIVGTIGAVLVHFLTGSMTAKALRGLGNVDVRQIGNAAQRQLSIMLGVVLLLFATSAILDRFDYLTTTNALLTGVTYTDASARIPAHMIVAAIAVICALLCFYNAWKVRWSIPAVSVALLVVSSMILSVAYPWFMQNFEVNPDEPDKERPFIAANIEATRYGFGIDEVEITDYEAETVAKTGQLKEDAAALPAIRLMDPAVIPPTFEQLQQVRGYYSFPKTLDIDRYDIDGRETDAVVAVRELDLASVESGETWNNKRTVYTHGYGMVA
ncbi:MAG: UPF0182 family protein, partial [Propionibacteriaceae bacterium]|nr:UPF0182 family protein [Propionibacteriaceae bacterium]